MSFHHEQEQRQNFQSSFNQAGKAARNGLQDVMEMFEHNPFTKMAKEAWNNASMNKAPSMDMSSAMESQRNTMAKIQEANQIGMQCLQHCSSLQVKALQDFFDNNMVFTKEVSQGLASQNPVEHQQHKTNQAVKSNLDNIVNFYREYLTTIHKATMGMFELVSQATEHNVEEALCKKDKIVQEVLKKKAA